MVATNPSLWLSLFQATLHEEPAFFRPLSGLQRVRLIDCASAVSSAVSSSRWAKFIQRGSSCATITNHRPTPKRRAPTCAWPPHSVSSSRPHAAARLHCTQSLATDSLCTAHSLHCTQSQRQTLEGLQSIWAARSSRVCTNWPKLTPQTGPKQHATSPDGRSLAKFAPADCRLSQEAPFRRGGSTTPKGRHFRRHVQLIGRPAKLAPFGASVRLHFCADFWPKTFAALPL